MKKKRSDVISCDELKRLIKYDGETGKFTWLVDSTKRNGYSAGDNASFVEKSGYSVVCVKGKTYQAHRIAWLYCYGYWPENYIDHINRVKDDNRISNLREVSPSCNVRNCKVKTTNKTGVTGANYNPKTKSYTATIRDQSGRQTSFCGLKTLREAAMARYLGELAFGYPDCDKNSSAKLFVDNNPESTADNLVEFKGGHRYSVGSDFTRLWIISRIYPVICIVGSAENDIATTKSNNEIIEISSKDKCYVRASSLKDFTKQCSAAMIGYV